MKKYFFHKTVFIWASLFSSLLYCNSIVAQDKYNDDIYKGALTFGLVNSFNLTSIVGSFPDIQTSNISQTTTASLPRFTFDIGITSDFYFNKKLSLQVDAVYTYNGAHFNSHKTIYNEIGKVESDEQFTYATSYFKFPISLVYYPKEQLYLSGGGYIAPLKNARRYTHWYNGSSNPLVNVSSLDYGLVFGLGFNFRAVKIGFQYNYGLSNMINDGTHNLHHSDYQVVFRWKLFSDVRKREKAL